MPWVSGTYQRVHDWTADAASPATNFISATRMDEEDDSIAGGLNLTLTRDGLTSPTANLPMATHRHTGVGAAAARTDYARYDQVQDSKPTWGGTSAQIASDPNRQSITLTPAITAYVAGQCFRFKAGFTNTGPMTLKVSALAEKDIRKDATADLEAGDVLAGQAVEVQYDGTRFQIVNLATTNFVLGDAPGIAYAWANIAADGTLEVASYGITSSTRTAAGHYSVVVTAGDMTTLNFIAAVTPYSGAPMGISYGLAGADTVTLIFTQYTGPAISDGFTDTDTPFHIVVYHT